MQGGSLDVAAFLSSDGADISLAMETGLRQGKKTKDQQYKPDEVEKQTAKFELGLQRKEHGRRRTLRRSKQRRDEAEQRLSLNQEPVDELPAVLGTKVWD